MKSPQLKKQYRAAKRRHMRRFKLWTRHPFAAPVFVFILLICLSVVGLRLLARAEPIHTDAKVVIISHDHVQQTVPSDQPTVGALLDKLHLTLNEGDVVEPAPDTPINQDDFRINIYRAVPVEIVDNGHRTFTFSAATTPRAIATQANIKTDPADYVTTEPARNFLRDGAIGQQVVISRSIPIQLNLYGTKLTIHTHATTVEDLLKEKNITLAKGDVVKPAPDTPIKAGQVVAIIRNGTRVVSVTETVAMPVQVINDSSLAYGTTAIRQHGSPGKRVVTYQIQLKNNKEVARHAIQTVVTVQPVTQIEVIGTNLAGIKGDMALAGISPGDYQYADYIISHESAWCPTKAQGEHYCPPAPDNPMTPNGYGLCQATPGYKMESAGSDWQTNPITQLKWCNGYAVGHYGSWYNAYLHWVSYHWW